MVKRGAEAGEGMAGGGMGKARGTGQGFIVVGRGVRGQWLGVAERGGKRGRWWHGRRGQDGSEGGRAASQERTAQLLHRLMSILSLCDHKEARMLLG